MPETTASRKWLLSLLLLLAAFLSTTSFVDQRADAEYEKLFQRALITFALARTINGVISVVQGTEIALQPAGVGVTLTPGEILDPVNDLVERFSWIMMGATVSLGIQNVLLEISAWWLIQALLAVVCAWIILKLWYPSSRGAVPKSLLKRFFLLLLFIRFAVPLMLIGNDQIYQLFLESRYLESSQIIAEAGKELEEMNAEQDAARKDATDPSLLDSIVETWNSTFDSLDMTGKLDRMQARVAEVVEHLLQLSVVFILQTGLLPIGFLWLFSQILKRLLRPLPRESTENE